MAHPSSPTTRWDRARHSFGAFTLLAYNLADLFVGFLLVLFDYYLYRVSPSIDSSSLSAVEISLVFWLSALLGSLLLVSSLLSFCAITNTACRSALIPSAYVGVAIAFTSCFLGTTIFALRSEVFRYLRDSDDFSQHEKDSITTWWITLGVGLFALCLTQILRYRASFSYRAELTRVDGAYEALLSDRDRDHVKEIERLQSGWEQRYAALRNYYEEKTAEALTYAPSPSLQQGSNAVYRDDDDATFYSAPPLPYNPSAPTVIEPPTGAGPGHDYTGSFRSLASSIDSTNSA